MDSKQLKEKTVKIILFLCASFSIILVLSIVGFLLYQGSPALGSLVLHGIINFDWNFIGTGRAVLAQIDGTVYIALGAAIVSAAIGIPCAIYMAEFADMRLRNFTKTSLEVLDGFPSIVIGLLIGWELLILPRSKYSFTGFLITNFGLVPGNGCILFAWLVLLIMSYPIIATISEDALRAVPNDLREASLGLGATKWQTTRYVLIPNATPRILTSILLALAAAMGEMVAISYVLWGTVPTALLYNPLMVLNPMVKTWTLSMNMESSYIGALDATGNPGAGPYALGCILFIMIGLVNIASRILLSNRGKVMEQ